MTNGRESVIERLNAALEGRYRIERELGEGGMATVFLAADLKHDRQVAMKVLRPELAAVVGGDRFLAEIRTTANLQHPNILPLFDSGEADGFLFYVMPYVEGESLREKLDREGQLPVDEAVGLAAKVANALGAAHEAGVIHRDIKPANILLSRGEPLVADFGIALAVQQAGGGRLTETGLSVGTPYYMSPEQATGERIGPPSDVYALGCVLYEMLVGEPPFGGGSAQAVLGRIIAGEPVAPARHRASIPLHVDAAIRKALEKVPADRFARAGDFAAVLSDPGFRHGEDRTRATGRLAWYRHPATIAAFVVALGSLSIAGWALGRNASGTADAGLPPEAPMQVGRTTRAFDVARDGSFIVYEADRGANTELWVRDLRTQEARPIPGTDGAYGMPMISPDGERVAFAAEGELRVVAVDGGPVSTVGEVTSPNGGEWLEDGRIYYVDGDGRTLRWVDPATGPIRDQNTIYCINPQLMPGDRVLCGGGADKSAFTRDLDAPQRIRYWRRSGTSDRVEVRGSDFRLVDNEYLVYISVDGSIMAARVEDLDSLTVGRSLDLVAGVRRETYTGVGQFDLTADGTLVYAPGINAEVGRLVRASPDGATEPMAVDEAAHLRFRPSPDGRRLATVIEGVTEQELRLYDLRSGDHQVLHEAQFVGAPVWGPDGRTLVYKVLDGTGPENETLYERRVDSPGEPRPLLRHGESWFPGYQPSTYLTPDSLLVGIGSDRGSAMLVDPTADPATVDSLGVNTLFISLSPDRRWVAWMNQSTGELFLQPWPAMDRRYPIPAVGIEPQWRSATEVVVFGTVPNEGDGITGYPFYQITIDPDGDPPIQSTEVLFRDPRFADTPGWSFSVTGDGDLIYLQSPDEHRSHYVRVIPGWVDAMKRAVDEANP